MHWRKNNNSWYCIFLRCYILMDNGLWKNYSILKHYCFFIFLWNIFKWHDEYFLHFVDFSGRGVTCPLKVDFFDALCISYILTTLIITCGLRRVQLKNLNSSDIYFLVCTLVSIYLSINLSIYLFCMFIYCSVMSAL